MSAKLIEVSPSAYQYPLLIKHLLHYPMAHSPDQEIVYRDLRRHSYREFRDRIGRLASGLAELGVKPGDVVGVLDWDSDRYLECYFAVPMMGAVLQTVNLSLPPEGLLFAMNDAAPSTVLVNADFLPLMERLADKLPSVRKYVLLNDRKERPTTRLPIECEYEDMLGRVRPSSSFRISTRTRARRRFTPPARPVARRAFTSATASWCCIRSASPRNMAARQARDGSIGTTSICR